MAGISDLASLLAAHNAASPAGGSPAMVNDDEPSSDNRHGKGCPDLGRLGRKSPGRSRASNITRP
jgi:hypothetical protein